jgi:GTP-binding protein
MRFIDEATLEVVAGDGGDGIVHWRREKFAPRGGPDGGDGGNGGAVIFVADSSLNTLLEFSYQPRMKGEAGEPGGDNLCTGKNGQDLICKVPVGCQFFYQDTLVADLSTIGARWVGARGGKGGKGNAFFKSSTNQSPDYAQPGQPGEQYKFKLVLKSVADVGLVGFPNVGKSTLISVISEAKPKIADYEFTTLTPNLGVVKVGEGRFVVADIPGLIPDAHLGKGLGIRFLKHIERTRGVAFVIDLFRTEGGESFLDRGKFQYEALEKELTSFSEGLGELPRVVVLTKSDLGLDESNTQEIREYFSNLKLKTCLFSSITKSGEDELKVLLQKVGISGDR